MPESSSPGQPRNPIDGLDAATLLAQLLGGGRVDAIGLPTSPAASVSLPDPPDDVMTFTVRVDLDSARPPVWRRLQVRGDIPMHRLHDVLQAAFGWWDCHLHRFWLGPDKRLWIGPYLLTDFDIDEGEPGVPEREVRLDQVLHAVGDRVFYTYDFGDEWNHTIKVEAVEAASSETPLATCIGGRRSAPMEDVGGIHEHNDIVAGWMEAGAAWQELDRPDATDWDPARFDVDVVDQSIQLATAEPDNVLALAAAHLADQPAMHPGLAEVLERAPDGLRTRLAAITKMEVDEASPRVRAEVVRPFRMLLELAEGGGIELTGAGWMPPAVVETLFHELNMDTFWIGEGNREHLTEPVHLVRTTTRAMGLLRTYKGRLLLTRAGNRVREDDDALWQRLVDWLVPAEPGAQRDATVLTLCEVARAGDLHWSMFDQVAAGMTELGWRADDRPIDRRDALQAAQTPWHVLRLIHDVVVASSPELADQAIATLAGHALRG